jgi:hypothetical protein
MKTIMLAFILTLGLNSVALGNLENLNDNQKLKLVYALNQINPEKLEQLLSLEGLDWYVSQFTRNSSEVENIDLLQALNLLNQDQLEQLLTDEAIEWYHNQFIRQDRSDERTLPFTNIEFSKNHGRAELNYDSFNDLKAPQFD